MVSKRGPAQGADPTAPSTEEHKLPSEASGMFAQRMAARSSRALTTTAMSKPNKQRAAEPEQPNAFNSLLSEAMENTTTSDFVL